MNETEMKQILKKGEDEFSQGNLKTAEAYFREILDANPAHVDALNNIGVIIFQKGEIESALSYFSNVLEIDPMYADAMENIGKILELQGEFMEALKCFQKALKTGALNAETLNSMANCFIKMDDLTTARTVLDQSLRIDGNQKNVRVMLENLDKREEAKQAQHPSLHGEPGSVGKKIRKSPAIAKSISFRFSKKLNIGFVSIWFERGQSYVTKILRDVIAHDHNTFVFARTGGVYGQSKLETSGIWDVPNLTTFPQYQIPPHVIVEWIKKEKLDAVIFNEEYDWNLVQAARETGIKILTYLDYYKDDWKAHMDLYDAVLCSTIRTYNLVKNFCKAHYMGWGVDTNLFHPNRGKPEFTFFHNAGWLGINFRKMTPAAIVSFDAISKILPEISLFIHSQMDLKMMPAAAMEIVKSNPRIVYHVETLPAPGLYHKGKIMVFPTKLEGLGLPLFEALACGMPVIATDAPPMNEFIIDGYNGILVSVATRSSREDNIAFPEEIVNINDLSMKMAILAKNPEAVQIMSLNARKYAETELSFSQLRDRILSCISTLFNEVVHLSPFTATKKSGKNDHRLVKTVRGSWRTENQKYQKRSI